VKNDHNEWQNEEKICQRKQREQKWAKMQMRRLVFFMEDENGE